MTLNEGIMLILISLTQSEKLLAKIVRLRFLLILSDMKTVVSRVFHVTYQKFT